MTWKPYFPIAAGNEIKVSIEYLIFKVKGSGYVNRNNSKNLELSINIPKTLVSAALSGVMRFEYRKEGGGNLVEITDAVSGARYKNSKIRMDSNPKKSRRKLAFVPADKGTEISLILSKKGKSKALIDSIKGLDNFPKFKNFMKAKIEFTLAK